MNAPEARDQLDLVDRILSRAEQSTCCLSAAPFIVWGVTGTILNLVAQLVVSHKAPPTILFVAVAALVAAIAWTIVWVRRLRGADRRTLVDRQIMISFTIAWIVALVIQLGAFQIFAQWAQAAIWSVMEGAAMLSVGVLVGVRAVVIGGALLLVSVVAANFAIPYAGFVLALGDLIGMAGAGALLYAGGRSSDG